MLSHRLLVALAALFSLIGLPYANAEEGDAILVLDASGSMWGQIDGEPKITIAKIVLADLLKDLPADRRLGLVAYGHNRKGDCTDIEELAAIGADRTAIAAAVKGINPKGKTPMADSVKFAAEKLRYTEQKATVILISDGIETCAPDPCGVAAALEAAGADFTVHVIGFDVTEENEVAQLQCIADNTGGLFVSASNASELGDALEATVVAAPEAVEPVANLYLRATELEGGLLIEEGLTWTITPSAGGDAVLTEQDTGVVETTIAPGEYDVAVMRPSDGLKGEAKGVVIRSNGQKTVTIALTFPVEATIRAEPAESGMAGTNVKVYFSGPERQGDYISIAEKASGDGAAITYSYAVQGNPAELRLPVEPGTYELRYVLGRPIRALVRKDFEVTLATATLNAPDTAVAGETVSVEFTGPPPGASDYVTITKPEAPDRSYQSYAYTKNGSPAEIRMPLEPGDYELRFVQASTKVLARKAITVTKAFATVKAPETALIGETVSVEFTGPPPASGDYITVTALDAAPNNYTDYAYTKNGSPAKIRMPVEPGEYEIRFIQGNKKIIARQTITVEGVESSVSTKTTAIAGETVSVEFAGPPAGSGDFITVTALDAPERKYNSYAYAKNGSPAEIRMPLEAGNYEIRYVQANKKVIARQPITVTAASATLDAPATAAAESTISVAFTGPPAGPGDYIGVSAIGAKDREYAHYIYVARGSPVSLRMPKDPGDYEVRFVQAGKKVLARRPIKVTAAE
jgi:Ca-activated chloride channel homolog